MDDLMGKGALWVDMGFCKEEGRERGVETLQKAFTYMSMCLASSKRLC